ncbi:SusC/RagA family TonB-linked outer membrane protein [Botryobacter ruber]|uniref:SusC/RagA family TonB-linked outer membrane protein n=1 Tax=Botryobacter ruber TaxID=2171629 RepID=UPI0013E324F3|nr:TonB-dependent receptor [Botryobacter ruber]
MRTVYPLKRLLLPCVLLGTWQMSLGQDLASAGHLAVNKQEKVLASLGLRDSNIAGVSAVQSQRVSGRILDEKGQGLPGVTVMLKGTSNGTVTDIAGDFSLAVPDGNGTLVISFVGYTTQEIPVNNRATVNVTLAPDAKALEELVVVGYGTQRKVNLTGSVASVSGKTLTERPAPNAANLLQGRVTGLQVTQPSGEPGRDNPNFLIRGRGTFGGSSAPLVLIDGVAGSFNNLSPDDIESVSVLKDAASASIYGSRAANGVILVTTKKGKKGQPTVSYRANVARHVATALPDLITNSAEYMEMYNQAAERSGVAFKYDPADIEKYRNSNGNPQYPNFDAIDYYINPATVTNHSLSVSGGGENSVYNLSLGYLDQDALIKGYNFKRYNALLNYATDLSKYVTVGTTMNLTYKDRKEPPFTGEGMALSIYATGPLYGPFLPDGSGRIVSRAYQTEGRNRNPQEYYAMGNQNSKEYNLNGQAYIDIKPFKGLTWSSKVAVNYVDEFYKMHQVPYKAYLLQEKDPETGDYKMATYGPDVLGVTDQYAKDITPTLFSTLTYETKFGADHNLNALAGYEQISYRQQALRARRINSVAPVLDELTGYTTENQSLFFTHPRLPGLPGPEEWALRSYFGRVNYNYKGKYLLETNLRYDGTSRVSPGYRWGLFPSVSAGWLVSDESFFKDNVNWVDLLKFRASYGTLGNQNIGTYAYQDIISINTAYPFGNTSLQQGGVVNQLRDKSLVWESTRIVDYGLDFALSRGLLGVSFDWFRKTSYDILAGQPVPYSLGLSSPTQNIGKMRSTGIELDLTHQNKIGEVSYGANFLISTAKNEVLEIPVPSKGSSIREVGYAFDAHYLYEWIGIMQESDFDENKKSKLPEYEGNKNPQPGDLKIKDQNGDGKVNGDDRIVVGGAYPDYTYSFGFNAGYKGFQLTAFFQGVQGLKARVNNWGVDPFMQGTAPTTKWRNAWTPENPTNELPALYIAGNHPGVSSYTGSTYYLKDASYLRMKNVMLSYTIPNAITSRLKMKELSVYFSGDNLLTWTDYEGGDPERASMTGNFSQYPQVRIFNFGTNVKF